MKGIERVAVKKARVTVNNETFKVEQKWATIKQDAHKVKLEMFKVLQDTAGPAETLDTPKRTKSTRSGSHIKGARAGKHEWSMRKDAMMKACRDRFAASHTTPKAQYQAVVCDICVFSL